MAQFEREMMLERQREGIAKAKAQGKYKGRKPYCPREGQSGDPNVPGRKACCAHRQRIGDRSEAAYRALEAAGLAERHSH